MPGLTGQGAPADDLRLRRSLEPPRSSTARLIFPIRAQPVPAAIRQLLRLSGLFLMNHLFMIEIARSMLARADIAGASDLPG